MYIIENQQYYASGEIDTLKVFLMFIDSNGDVKVIPVASVWFVPCISGDKPSLPAIASKKAKRDQPEPHSSSLLPPSLCVSRSKVVIDVKLGVVE